LTGAFHHDQPEQDPEYFAGDNTSTRQGGILAPRPSTEPSTMPNPFVLPFLEWARRLRFPTLFKLTAAVFALSVLVPDPIPFVDEIALGLGTLMLANWKRRKDPLPPPSRPLRPRR